MIDKSAYLDKFAKMDAIFNKYDFLAQSGQQCGQLKNAIDDFAFRVVLIGGFSSGKSAFLNRLTGRHLFREELGPETALPAEVSWAPVESCDAVFNDGSKASIPIDTATANPPKDARYISMRLDNDFLKQRPELILVDFPGFDSNVKAHNEAITAYLKKGSAFLLFIPASNGSLTSSDIKFVREAASYPQALGCFISKADVRPAEKCAEIADYVRRGIAMHYGVDVPVTLISSMPDCAPDFEERVAAMVDRFNPQTLFNLSIAPAINEQLVTAIAALEEYMNSSQLDSRELEQKIAASQENVETLAMQLKKERAGLDRKYQYEIIPDIMGRLENAFHANIDFLVEAAMAGEQRFGDVAQSIARPILAGVPGEIQANLRDVISKIQIDNKPGLAEDNRIRDALLNMVDVISTFIPTAGGKDASHGSPKSGAPGGAALSSLGTGVLVGALGNPVLGAVIALAPALINLFFGGGQKKMRDPDPRQSVRAQLEANGIPAAMARLESAITPAVMETRDMMFKEIEQKIRESQQTAIEAMEQAKNEIAGQRKKHAESMEQIQSDIQGLRELLI